MNSFKYYVISWAVLLGAFNAIVFACAGGNFSTAFWIGYAFITAAFIGQLLCAWVAFKPANLTKKFYNIPLVTQSYVGLILMLIFGGLFMAVPGLPIWAGVVVCVVILACTAVAVMKAAATSDIVGAIDQKVAAQTAFIKDYTKEAELLVSQAKSDAVKADASKVFEAFRYSPKRSGSSTPDLEKSIADKFVAFTTAVQQDNSELTSQIGKEIEVLIKRR